VELHNLTTKSVVKVIPLQFLTPRATLAAIELLLSHTIKSAAPLAALSRPPTAPLTPQLLNLLIPLLASHLLTPASLDLGAIISTTICSIPLLIPFPLLPLNLVAHPVGITPLPTRR
jgi:hypothetical protein